MSKPLFYMARYKRRFICRNLKGLRIQTILDLFVAFMALYGLKQSSRIWNEKLSSFLREFNLIATSADSCLYFSKLNSCLLIMLFVDDGMVINKVLDQVAHILEYMGEAFQITIGYPEVYVGLHIVRDRERCII